MNTNPNTRAALSQSTPLTGLDRAGLPLSLVSAVLALSLGACSAPPSHHANTVEENTPSTVNSKAGIMNSVNTLYIDTVVGNLAIYDTGRPSASGSQNVMVLWPSILADHHIYLDQLAAWKSTHRVILIDGPGHGASGPAPGPFTMEDCADAQAQILDHLNVNEPVVSIGTSWGGLVGGEFAMKYPNRTRAVVMLNTPVYSSNRGLGDRMIVWGARWMHALSLYTGGVAKAFFLPETRSRQSGFIQEFHRHLHKADGKALALSVGSVLLDREDLASRMHKITVPTLFIAGQQDDMYPIENLQKAAARLPHGRFLALPSAHISSVDAPLATIEAIDAFLASL